MAGDGGIQFQLTGCDGPQRMDPAAGGIHFVGQHAIAGAGGQAETAVHAGVCGTIGEARTLGGRAHQQSLTELGVLLRHLTQCFVRNVR